MSHASDPFRRSFDGAAPQAVAVLAMLPYFADGLNASYANGHYQAEPRTHRWQNGREQGYVISMMVPAYTGKQINIAFFEHRNTDEIHAVMFEAQTFGEGATIHHIPKDHPYNDSKNGTDYRVSFGQVAAMAAWIIDQLQEFWEVNAPAVADSNVAVEADEFPIAV